MKNETYGRVVKKKERLRGKESNIEEGWDRKEDE